MEYYFQKVTVVSVCSLGWRKQKGYRKTSWEVITIGTAEDDSGCRRYSKKWNVSGCVFWIS